jgi:peroxiredoxin
LRFAVFVAAGSLALAGQQKVVWSPREQPIVERVWTLRKVPDAVRSAATRDLAREIRQLPVTPNKLVLATSLASLSTEGDYGLDTLQEVATTLFDAVKEQPPADEKGLPAAQYMELAQLARYEHVKLPPDPLLEKALSRLEAIDQIRQAADFTLLDLNGKTWRLKELRGKVVLVNFWATWCPPCRKEMPDMEALYQHFAPKGLVIFGISDEDASKVSGYIAAHPVSYPILIDAGRKVNELYQIEGIPKSFLYDREGKLVAQAIDMRTKGQFLEMLRQAGIQ